MLSVEAAQTILNQAAVNRAYSLEEARKLRDMLQLFARAHLDMIRKQVNNGKDNK